MKAIKIPVEGKAKIIEIEGKTVGEELKALQHEVGGYIKTLTIAEDCCLIVDEEGLLKGKAINHTASRLGRTLVGDVLVCGVEYDHFVDVPDAMIVYFKERCLI
jgi:hypothetical protein